MLNLENIYLICIILFVICLMLIIGFIWQLQKQQNKKIENILANSMQGVDHNLLLFKNDLDSNLQLFKQSVNLSVKDDMASLNEQLNQKLLHLTQNVNQGLQHGFEKTNVAFLNMEKNVVALNETQKNLNLLSQDIINLQKIFTDKKSRGTFGEVELYTLLDLVFANNPQRYIKQAKLNNGRIVDCLLLTPEPLGNIVIDSKFPLENYNRLVRNQLSETEKIICKRNFKNDVKKHILDIYNKYVVCSDTADYAYMFIPSEAIFQEICTDFIDLLQLSYEKHVYFASPTTLMAYLTAIRNLFLQIGKYEHLTEIHLEYQKLALEFNRYEERFSLIKKDFERINNDFRNLEITHGKIMNKFTNLDQVKLEK